MSHPVWLYHKDKAPQIFDSDDVPKLMEDGWRDSPEAANAEFSRKDIVEAVTEMEAIYQPSKLDATVQKRRGKQPKEVTNADHNDS